MIVPPTRNEIVIARPRPHPGQQRILDAAGRFNVVRCGRRFGKSTIGVCEVIAALLRGEPVGWFSARFDLFLLVWEELLWRLRPIIISKQEVHRTFRTLTGGVFKGWSLDSDDPGRSAHYALIVIDEAGLVPNPRTVAAALATIKDHAHIPANLSPPCWIVSGT